MAVSRNVIRKYKVPQKLGISRATLALWQNKDSRYFQPLFPAEISLSESVKVFFEDELDAFLESRKQTKIDVTNTSGSKE